MEPADHIRAEAHYYHIMDMKEKYQKLKRNCRNGAKSSLLTSASKSKTLDDAGISTPKINLRQLFRQSEQKCDQVLEELRTFDGCFPEKRRKIYGNLITLTDQLNRLTPEMEDQTIRAMQIIAFLEGLSSLLNASKLKIDEFKDFEKACQEYYRQVLQQPDATILEPGADTGMILSLQSKNSLSRSEIGYQEPKRTIGHRFRSKTIPNSVSEFSKPEDFSEMPKSQRRTWSSDNLSQLAAPSVESRGRYLQSGRKIETFCSEEQDLPCKERYIRSRDITNNGDTFHGHLRSNDPIRTKSFIPSSKLSPDMAIDDHSSNYEKLQNKDGDWSKTFRTLIKYFICILICIYIVDLSRKIYETIIVPFDNCTLANDLCETSRKCCFRNCESDSKRMFWTNFKKWK